MIQTQADVRKALVITQHDIEARFMGLYEIKFKKQRFGLGVRYGDFDNSDLMHECLNLGVHVCGTEVRPDTILKVFCLADVQPRPLGVHHSIDPGTTRQRRDKIFGVKFTNHYWPSPANAQACATTDLNMGTVSRRVWVL